MNEPLAAAVEAGRLRAVDAALATRIAGRAGELDPAVILAAAVLSRAVSEGHGCLPLEALAIEIAAAGEPARDVVERLARSPLVAADGAAPLVLDAGERVYLQRQWVHEGRVAADLCRRAEAPMETIDAAALSEVLGRFFPVPPPSEAAAPDPDPTGLDGQRLAAGLAAHYRLTIVTGGPGTGKTTTAARIVATLLELGAGRPGGAPRIGIAAPTGKGAARLAEALASELARLPLGAAARESLPIACRTVHRLLGARPDARSFRHDAADPLPLDALLVDEASMIDLALLARLLAALRPGAKLVLLGDPDQLASIEPGAVLQELCAGPLGYEPALAERLAMALPPALAGAPSVDHRRVHLRRPFRFRGGSGVSALADAIRGGDADTVIARLEDREGVDWRRLAESAAPDALAFAAALETGYRGYFEALEAGAAPGEVLACFEAFRVLAPFRRGPWGTGRLNDAAGGVLRRRLELRPGPVPGEPLMVVRNDYATGLFNGDVGVLAASPGDGVLRAHFPPLHGAPAPMRAISLARLPAHEPAFALTVHKAQGSEFERVLIMLPTEAPAGVGVDAVGRELLYTAVTRARAAVTIWSSERALRRAVANPAPRASGLRARLQRAAPGAPDAGRA